MATERENKAPTDLEKHIQWIERRLKQPVQGKEQNQNVSIDGSELQLVDQASSKQMLRTLRTKALFIYMLSNVWNVASACRRIGISRKTYYDWISSDSNFKEMVDEVEDMKLDFVEDQAIKKIGEGCSRLIEFYLRTKGKKRGFTEEITSYEDDTIEFTLNIGKKKLTPPKDEQKLNDTGS
jgi:hypothetical protein